MFKPTNSLMIVVTAAKIVVPSFLLTGFFALLSKVRWDDFHKRVAFSVLAVLLILLMAKLIQLQITGFFKKPKTLTMTEKSGPGFFIILITTLFLIPFLMYISWDEQKYVLLFFPFACVIFSFCYWCFKMPGTSWNKKGWEDQIFKFKGWKYDLKSTSLNLAFLIFLLSCSLIFGTASLYLGSVPKTWFIWLTALCAFWNLCLFFLWGWKIKKLTNKSDRMNFWFLPIIAAQAQMFVSSYKMLSDDVAQGQSILSLLNFYLLLLFIIYTNQKFIDISRRTHLPVVENIVQNKFLPENI